jgi:branched-chain amino acid transport system permease protein
MTSRFSPGISVLVLVAVLAVAVLPLMMGGQWLQIITSTACLAIAAAGVGFMYARLGMVSLAQVGLMGVGGWVMLRLNHGFGLPFEINLAVAAVVTMVCGWVLAMPALRMRGLYLALVTLMAASGLEIVLSTFRFPNGGEGFWGVAPSLAAPFRRPFLATSDAAYLRYVLCMLGVAFLLIEVHRRSAPGRAWAMIRRSEAAAMASGVNVVYYKAWAFGLSGLLAGMAGALLAGLLGLLDPATFRASESIMLFALAVVGGARHWLGAVLAAVLYRVVPALFNNWGLDADLALVVFGAALMHALITAPDGLAGQLLGLRRNKKAARTWSN